MLTPAVPAAWPISRPRRNVARSHERGDKEEEEDDDDDEQEEVEEEKALRTPHSRALRDHDRVESTGVFFRRRLC